MTNDDEELMARSMSLFDPRMKVPRRGVFTLVVSDLMHFEVTESGRTIRLDFRPKTLPERVALWRRRFGL